MLFYRKAFKPNLREVPLAHEKKDSRDKIRIDITDGFAVERALKKFKRLCDAYGIVKEYRAREYYQKPSVKKMEKLENAEKRRKKTNSKTRGSKKI